MDKSITCDIIALFKCCIAANKCDVHARAFVKMKLLTLVQVPSQSLHFPGNN